MENNELMKKLAMQEFINDQLEAELSYMNNILKAIGFPEGLESVKAVANEMIEDQASCEER